jgi:hypothetical protein
LFLILRVLESHAWPDQEERKRADAARAAAEEDDDDEDDDDEDDVPVSKPGTSRTERKRAKTTDGVT